MKFLVIGKRNGFTLVELAVIVGVISILATVSFVGWNSWQTSLAKNEVNHELQTVAAAMKNDLNFNNAYPTSVSTKYSPGANVTVQYVSGDASSYCIEATSKRVSSVTMFIKSTDPVPKVGTCATGGATGGGEIVANPGINWTMISTGIGKICGISTDGSVYCWDNANTAPRPVKLINLPLGLTAKSISLGIWHMCIIASDDNAYCTGDNTKGQLGNGDTVAQTNFVPVVRSGVLAGKTIKKISATHMYKTCAIASDNMMYCWGESLGVATPMQSSVPVQVNFGGKTVIDMDVGANTTCAIASDFKVYCWGMSNGAGALGTGGMYAESNTPVAVSTSGVLNGKQLQQISASGSDAWCARDNTNDVYCWGRNRSGGLGDSTTTDRDTPVQFALTGSLAGKKVTSIKMDGDTTCVLATDNLPHCVGAGTNGRLGNGTDTSVLVPTAVSASVFDTQTITGLYGSGGRLCVISTSKQTYCWGTGPLGDGRLGTTSNSNVPKLVLEP